MISPACPAGSHRRTTASIGWRISENSRQGEADLVAVVAAAAGARGTCIVPAYHGIGSARARKAETGLRMPTLGSSAVIRSSALQTLHTSRDVRVVEPARTKRLGSDARDTIFRALVSPPASSQHRGAARGGDPEMPPANALGDRGGRRVVGAGGQPPKTGRRPAPRQSTIGRPAGLQHSACSRAGAVEQR